MNAEIRDGTRAVVPIKAPVVPRGTVRTAVNPNPGDAPVRLTDLKMRVDRLAWKPGDREIVFSGKANQSKAFLYRIRPVPRSLPADLTGGRLEGEAPAYSRGSLAYVKRVLRSSIWEIEMDSSRGQFTAERASLGAW